MQAQIQLFLLFFLFSTLSEAQDLGSTTVRVNDQVSVGKLTGSGKEVFARQFMMPEHIYYTENGDDGRMTLVLREVNKNGKYKNNGYLVGIDLATGNVNWDIKIHYFSVKFTKDNIAYLYGGDTKIFDKKTGKFLYSAKGEYEYIDKERNFAITAAARCIDLATGASKWFRKIPSETGFWEEFKLVNDSTAIIASKGLHQVNLNDGKGWSIKLQTTSVDAGAIIATAMAGAMFGAMGASMVYIGSSYGYSGYSSNILLDTLTNDIYYASLKDLQKLNMDGTSAWKIPLGRNESSMAMLLDRGEKIIHINKGLIMNNGIEGWAGLPYISGYSKETGKEIYRKILPRGGIRFMTILKDTVLLRVLSNLYKYDLVNGVLLDSIKDERSKGYKETDGSKFYTERDGDLFSLPELYRGQFVVLDDSLSIAVLDKGLGKERTFNQKDLWILQGVYEDLNILKREDDIRVVRDNKSVAELKLKGKLQVDRHVLQVIDKETLYIIDLRSIKQ